MLVILATHPIQYQIPIWKGLAARQSVPFEVWYLTSHGIQPTLDKEFGRVFKWDVDLLSGYPHRFPQKSVSQQLGSFWETRLPDDFRDKLRSGHIKAILIHGWQARACWEVVILASKLKIPIWVRGESNDLKPDPYIKGLIKKYFLGSYLRKVHSFLSIGQANARLYLSYGISPDRLRQSPYCVDNERFVSQAAVWRNKRKVLRQAWGISDNDYCLLFVGKFIEKKRPLDIVDAMVLLQSIDQSRRYHALFVGTGVLGPTLRNRCQVVYDEDNLLVAAPVGQEVGPLASFAGFMNQTEISKAYVAADALVLPSDPNETWGLVVNEAMASGLPCIVSEACGSAEDLVVPLDPKLRFPLADTKALAESVKHLAEHPITTQKIAAHISKYDFSVTVNTIESLWCELSNKEIES